MLVVEGRVVLVGRGSTLELEPEPEPAIPLGDVVGAASPGSGAIALPAGDIAAVEVGPLADALDVAAPVIVVKSHHHSVVTPAAVSILLPSLATLTAIHSYRTHLVAVLVVRRVPIRQDARPVTMEV